MVHQKLTLGKSTTRKLTSQEKKNFKDSGGKRIKSKNPIKLERKSLLKRADEKVSKFFDQVTGKKQGGGLGVEVAKGSVLAALPVGRAEGIISGATRIAKGAANKIVGFAKGVPKTAEIARKRGLTVVDEIGQVGKSGRVQDLSKIFFDVDKIGKGLKSSQAQITAQAKAVAARRVNQITDRIVGSRFAVNAKSQGLTKSFMVKLGLGIGAAGLAVSAIGTYPFAGFIREEAVQTLGFAFNTARGTGDIEGMELAIRETEEILNAEEDIIRLVPFANVVVELRKFFKAARTKLEIDKRTLEEFSRDLEGEGEFESASERTGREIGERDTAQAESQEERDKSFAESEERRETRDEEFAASEEKRSEERTARDAEFAEGQAERDTLKAEELEFESQFFKLIREKRFDEADKLQAEFIKKLKGGN